MSSTILFFTLGLFSIQAAAMEVNINDWLMNSHHIGCPPPAGDYGNITEHDALLQFQKFVEEKKYCGAFLVANELSSRSDFLRWRFEALTQLKNANDDYQVIKYSLKILNEEPRWPVASQESIRYA